MIDNWHEQNQGFLTASLARVRVALQNHAARAEGGTPLAVPDGPAPCKQPSALETIMRLFDLSPFERDTLLLCAGTELDGGWSSLCAMAQGDPQRGLPTFSLALAALPDAHWSAITPTGPLRRLRLIELGTGGGLTSCPLRIDERILHYLTGVDELDERLASLLDAAQIDGDLVPSHQALAERIAGVWARPAQRDVIPAVQLCGSDRDAKRAVAAAACARAGLRLNVLAAGALPATWTEVESLLRLWGREAPLLSSALLLDADELDWSDAGRAALIARMTERTPGALLVTTSERRRFSQRPTVTFDVTRPTPSEQRALWRKALGPIAQKVNGSIERLTAQFDVGAPTIRVASVEALALNSTDPGQALWDACRDQARPRLDDLAQRIDATAGWDDLVLPDAQRQILGDIAAHVRQRATVYETWGFATQGSRGLGISALFAGASGTGKTMAAEVLARELHLDLYRIDLSAVVSKYIGETEKNLRQVFDAAEQGGAVLLFDEADALFGKRSEVKDSHDRYANIEVSYLLQRMESYRGLAILTTNLKSSLDTAFLRRLRFVVQFPFPDAVQRAEIWRRVFPRETPTDGLDPLKLAQLTLAGGNIRSIAINSAFLAADAEQPVRMIHALRAAQSEYAKLEKTLTDSEVAGWA